jgi:hypothetical protein
VSILESMLLISVVKIVLQHIRRQSGRQMLKAGLSAFDPWRTCLAKVWGGGKMGAARREEKRSAAVSAFF